MGVAPEAVGLGVLQRPLQVVQGNTYTINLICALINGFSHTRRIAIGTHVEDDQ